MAESLSKDYFSKNNFQACHNKQFSTSRFLVFCFVVFFTKRAKKYFQA